MADPTLALLATEVHGKTLKLLDGVSDEQAKFAALRKKMRAKR